MSSSAGPDATAPVWTILVRGRVGPVGTDRLRRYSATFDGTNTTLEGPHDGGPARLADLVMELQGLGLEVLTIHRH